MTVFANILIFQPAAIGDVMLATPVAKALKQNYPGAKITFWGHGSLHQLLIGCCPHIEEYIDYDKQMGLIALLKLFWAFNCDLFVDLSNSKKGMFMAAFAPGNISMVAYQKQPAKVADKMHAVENFLESVARVCPEIPDPLFPTIFPPSLAEAGLENIANSLQNKNLIGIVPGVGKHRPHRAWIPDGWQYLITTLLERQDCLPVLIGGNDEIELGESLEQALSNSSFNLIGKLDLVQTASVLKQCKLVISCDTGPAHMAVAVGTPVIGLYGPTSPRRSGPYGCNGLVIDQSQACKCADSKTCNFAIGSGECMSRIMLPEVLDKITEVIGPSAILEAIEKQSKNEDWQRT